MLPGTGTKMELREKYGLSINGQWNRDAIGVIILSAIGTQHLYLLAMRLTVLRYQRQTITVESTVAGKR